MREIKFRAWEKKSKEMIEVSNIHFEKGIVNYSTEDNPLPWRFIGEVVLMQSTGLKDKDGVEIFEGDIVAFEDSDGGYEYPDLVVNTGIVEYGDLGFYFTNRVAVEMDDFYIKDGRCDEVEVIGNIYEHSDLLN